MPFRGHTIEMREQGPWWIRYSVAGKLQCVGAESAKRADAVRLLKEREGDVAKGLPIHRGYRPDHVENAAEDLLTDYRVKQETLAANSHQHDASVGMPARRRDRVLNGPCSTWLSEIGNSASMRSCFSQIE